MAGGFPYLSHEEGTAMFSRFKMPYHKAARVQFICLLLIAPFHFIEGFHRHSQHGDELWSVGHISAGAMLLIAGLVGLILPYTKIGKRSSEELSAGSPAFEKLSTWMSVVAALMVVALILRLLAFTLQ